MASLVESLIRSQLADRLVSKAPRKLPYSSTTLQGDEDVTIRFLGTATFVIEGYGRTLVFDPYVSRPSLKDHMTQLLPDKQRIRETFPTADDVFVGHAHSDHILDAPDLCLFRSARLVGSESVYRTGRAAGLPETSILKVRDGDTIGCGNQGVRVTAIGSRHAPVLKNKPLIKLANRALQSIRVAAPHRPPEPIPDDRNDENFGVLFPGETRKDLQWPAYTWELGCGEVFDWLVEMGGTKIVHIDSARLGKDELAKLEGQNIDILCLCAMGRKHNDYDFTRTVLEALRPKIVIPCHWDNFFAPVAPDGRMHPLPSAKIKQWVRELEEMTSKYGFPEQVHLLKYNQVFGCKKAPGET